MKTHRLTITGLFMLAALLTAVMVPRLSAEIPDNPLPWVDQSIDLMRQGKWQESLELNQRIVEVFGATAPKEYGARFGGVYFRKGMCELKLLKWDEAMKSFETCRKDFANPPGITDDNPFQRTCLLVWADAAMAKQEWTLALELLATFRKECVAGKDSFDPGLFFINQAICQYHLDDFEKGHESFETVLTQAERYPVAPMMIVRALKAQGEAVIRTDKEQELLDFIAKHRAALSGRPGEMFFFGPVFIRLATESIQAGMTRAAVEWCGLAPDTADALADARACLESLGGLERIRFGPRQVLARKEVEERLARIERAMASDRSVEMSKLAVMALIHERSGNLRGAYVAYRELEESYPHSSNRENNLFNLVRVAFAVETLDVMAAF